MKIIKVLLILTLFIVAASIKRQGVMDKPNTTFLNINPQVVQFIKAYHDNYRKSRQNKYFNKVAPYYSPLVTSYPEYQVLQNPNFSALPKPKGHFVPLAY